MLVEGQFKSMQDTVFSSLDSSGLMCKFARAEPEQGKAGKYAATLRADIVVRIAGLPVFARGQRALV